MANGINFLSLLRNTKTRRVMQLQAQLLKELALSPDNAKNWRNQVKAILSDAADVLDIYFFYAFLAGEDEKYTIEFFWLREPPPETMDALVHAVKRKLAENGESGGIQEFGIVHSTAEPGSTRPNIPAGRVELLDKMFRIAAPKDSGIVGIGLNRRKRRSAAEAMAIDSVLTAFTNVIGSVKGLLAYTKEVERFATRDPLTNLYNQISFWDLLEYETNRSKRQQYKFSLLIIDLDNFKAINDTYGHEIGDAFLKHFSSIFKNAVRAGDIAARYAGDQFAAILPVCNEIQAAVVAKRIIENLRGSVFPLPTGGTIKGTVSVGIAVYPDHAQAAKDIYLLAESMLTQAKSFGKDRLSIPSVQDDINTVKSIGEKSILILDALAQKRIVPYFQPIINVNTMQTEAYEVLTRIVTPDRIIPASDFIEAAEGMGAIGKIDYQLFEHALAKARESRYGGTLFINLSPKALVLDEFMPTIRKLLRDYGLDPAKLIFEITERDTVKNLRLFDRFIRELKQEGFQFAIDDFGAGYSSFQYIKTFSVDFLKVDGGFVRNMVGNGTVEKQIVISIAALAEHLGIRTIAEYVESEEILGEVRSAGINFAQGYYIRKPSPDLI